jgi:AraC family transcriptional regulator
MQTRSIPVSRGRPDRTLAAGGFVLTETFRTPGLVLARHCHRHTNIALVLRGSFIETVNERPFEVNSYSLILRPGGEPHANSYGRTEARCLIIEVQPPRLEMIQEISRVLERSQHIRDAWVPALASQIHKELRIRDSVSPLAIESLVLELLAQAARNDGSESEPEPRWLRQARILIHEEFIRPLSLSRVAESVGIHPAHLARKFRRHYRCTVGDYVRRLRLNRAATELLESDKPLAEIALDCGFYDQSHFTHAFKLQYGLTPSNFRLTRNENRTKRACSYKTV